MTRKEQRLKDLMPGGIPRYVRCYDDGGQCPDRYTVVFTKKPYSDDGNVKTFLYVGMSEEPFHPCGIGVHGCTDWAPADAGPSGWAPNMGRKCHLGTRIPFSSLPGDCQRMVTQDYVELWGLMDPLDPNNG